MGRRRRSHFVTVLVKLGYLLNPTFQLYGLGGVAWIKDHFFYTSSVYSGGFFNGDQTRHRNILVAIEVTADKRRQRASMPRQRMTHSGHHRRSQSFLQHEPVEERRKLGMAVERQDVRDELVRPHDDEASVLPVDLAHVEDIVCRF